MIKLKRRETGKPVITTMKLAGQPFEIEMLPLEEKERLKLLKPFLKSKYVHNPVSGKMDAVSYFDDADDKGEKVINDLLDSIVVNFSGVGDTDGKELDGSMRDNKILLGSVEVESIEEIVMEDPETKEKITINRPRKTLFRNLILDKAVELSKTMVEAEVKN